MTVERLITAAYPLMLCSGLIVMVVLLVGEERRERRERRAEAERAERQARPHSAHVGTAAQDAAAITLAAIKEQHRA